MAVVSRIATLRLDDTATHTTTALQYVATAAVQDTPAGQSVVITTVRTVIGSSATIAADTLTLNLYTDAGTLIRAFTLAPATASQVSTFHFTSDGTAGGAPRAGTVEIALRATRTTPTAYDIETDGSPNTQPTGFDSHLDRGYIRGTTTATTTLSNVALGGAKVAPAEYDESLFARTTVGADFYVARSLTVAISGAAPALSATTNSATSGNFDATLANVVDDRFPAAVTTVSTSLTVSNSTLTGQPATVLTATNDSINVDPRLTAASHLWQADDDQIGTPPMSKNDESRSALVSSYSGLAFRLVTARTLSGVNGLSTTVTLDPRGPGSAIARVSSTSTRGGETGWTELAQLGPFVVGGAWDATLTVATADIDAVGYVLANTEVVTILAPDPRIQLRGYINKRSNQKGHFTEGDALTFNVTVTDLTTLVRIDPARVTEPSVGVIRYRSTDDRLECLASDGLTWITWEPTVAAPSFPMAPSPNDARNYIRTFSDTTGWSRDISAALFTAKVDGTPYSGFTAREETGAANSHTQEDAVTAAEIASIANAVWDELSSEARPPGSYGAVVGSRLDAAVSTRATPADVSGGGGVTPPVGVVA